MDGPYRSEGRLEVFLFNRWYTPCGVTISTNAATAVCYQLGYTTNGGPSIMYVYVVIILYVIFFIRNYLTSTYLCMLCTISNYFDCFLGHLLIQQDLLG